MKALIGVVMMCVAGGVAAEGQVTKLEYCTQWAGLAQDFMTARQIGVPMSKVIDGNEEFNELAMDAYSVPAYAGIKKFNNNREASAIFHHSAITKVICFKNKSIDNHIFTMNKPPIVRNGL